MQPSRGFGDTVTKLIKYSTLGLIPPCLRCQQDAEKLNALFPYKTQEEIMKKREDGQGGGIGKFKG